jgi:hypothetical protein
MRERRERERQRERERERERERGCFTLMASSVSSPEENMLLTAADFSHPTH